MKTAVSVNRSTDATDTDGHRVGQAREIAAGAHGLSVRCGRESERNEAGAP